MKKMLRMMLLAVLLLPLGVKAQCPDDAMSCSFTIVMHDSFGDGWNGNAIKVYQNDSLLQQVTLTTGANGEVDVQACALEDSNIVFVWVTGNYASETSFEIYNGNGDTVVVAQGSNYMSNDTIARMALVCPTCIKPSDLTLDSATITSLTVSWTPGNSESAWQIMLDDSLINADETPYTILNLASATGYMVKVRSICGSSEGDTSAWSAPVRMLTLCNTIDSLPWHDNFDADNEGETPFCWTLVDSVIFYEFSWVTYDYEMTVYPYIYDNYSYGNVLYYYNGGEGEPESGIIASPYIAVDPTTWHVTFDAYSYFDAYSSTIPTLQAGILTDLSDPNSFIPLITVSGDSWASYEFYTDTISALEDLEGAYIAFRYEGGTEYAYAYVKNINVATASGCRAPALNSGEIDSVTYQSVLLSWAATSADSYDVMLLSLIQDEATGEYDSIYTHYEALEDSIVVDSLIAGTFYQAFVASVCGDDTTDYLYIGSFTTQLRCYSIINVDVPVVTANAATVTWNYREGYGIDPEGVLIGLMDLEDSSVFLAPTFVEGTTYTFTGLTTNHEYQIILNTLCGEGNTDTATAAWKTFIPVLPPCAEVDGNGTATYVPFMGNYDYAFTESLYDAAMLDGVDTVRSIAWEIISPASNHQDRMVDIYMGYTSDTALSINNFVTVNTLTKVADSVQVNVGTVGWITVPLTTPFVPVDTTGVRLVIAVVNNSGVYNSITWGVSEMTAGSSVYWYCDGTPIDPANVPSLPYGSGAISKVPDVRILGDCGSGDCLPPSVMVSAYDSTSITISWLAGGSETSWAVQYRPLGDSVWATTANVTTIPYIATGLTPATSYQIRVGAECSGEVAYSSILTVLTDCSPVHAPVSIDFNTTTNHPCWDITPTNINTTYGAINLYSSYRIISPEIADSLMTLQVVVNARSYSATPTSTQYVMVGACDADGSNIVGIDTVAITAEFADYILYLDNYTGTANHLIVKHPTGSDIYIHSVSIAPIPECRPVSDLTVDSVSTTEASLSWNSPASSFAVCYKVYDDSTASWSAPVEVDTSIVTLSNLDPSTKYIAAVSVDCGPDGYSDSVYVIFMTECSPFSVPFHEDLDASVTYAMPDCWTNTTLGTTYTSWSESVLDGYPYLISYAAAGVQVANDWLITPAIAIPADANTTDIQLVFATGGESQSYYSASEAALEVYVSTTGKDISNFTDTLLVLENITGATLSYQHISLANYAGQTVYFGFRNVSKMYGFVGLADVNVRSMLVPNYRVYGTTSAFVGDTLTYVAVRQEGDTATMHLTWYSVMADSNQATILANGSDTMRIVFHTDGVDSLSFIATNNHGADTISWHVNIISCPVITEFPWEEPFADSTALACWLQEGSSEWTIGSGVYEYSSVNTAHSAPYNALCVFPAYDENATKLITPKLNLTGMSDVKLAFWHVQPAWSGDVDELYVLGRTSGSSPWDTLAVYTADISAWRLDTVNIPTVSATYQIAFEMVGNYGYGVGIDDLTVFGSNAQCPMPVVTVTAIEETSISISIEGEANSYEVVCMTGEWTEPASGTAISGTTHTFGNLTASTAYQLGVRAVCIDNTYSEWVVRTATTANHPCEMPTDVTLSDLTLTGGTVSWTAGEEGQENFEVHITNAATGLDSIVAVQGTSHTFTNLISGETYNITVRAVCSATSQSNWTTAVTLIPMACDVPTNVTAEVQGRRVTVSWEGTAEKYRVTYFDEFHTIRDAETVEVENATSVTVTVPEGGMDYSFYVQAYCGEALSQYSEEARVSVLGIDAVEASNVNLYPNPASTTVTIDGIEGEATVTVVDMNGREVYNAKTNSNLSIDLNGYAKGAYFVRIAGERTVAIRKLIVK